jgi:hypothetical protein
VPTSVNLLICPKYISRKGKEWNIHTDKQIER